MMLDCTCGDVVFICAVHVGLHVCLMWFLLVQIILECMCDLCGLHMCSLCWTAGVIEVVFSNAVYGGLHTCVIGVVFN